MPPSFAFYSTEIFDPEQFTGQKWKIIQSTEVMVDDG